MFVLLPVIDLFILSFFGWYFTLLSMLAGGFAGAAIIRLQGLRYWYELNDQISRKEIPTAPALHGSLIFLAGCLAVMPGILTDIIALFLFFPLTRAFTVSYIILR
ncbi:MAG: FxsA family protein, partial [Planctomycetaceae bacterium]|nr:FxsA family protein [Planctomycetaceae bacterium]